MPLSEEEQKILKEIEAQLHASDPDLADQVRRTTVYRHAGRYIRFALATTVLGLVLLLTQFTDSTVFAAAGFLVMLASLLVIADNLKKMGKATLHDIFGLRTGVHIGFADALRERLRREQQDDDSEG